MVARDVTLLHVSDLVETELAKFLTDAFIIAGVISELLPDPDGEDYVRTTVILEDGHPELDPRTLNKFSQHLHPFCAQRGFDLPTIAYANRSEIPA